VKTVTPLVIPLVGIAPIVPVVLIILAFARNVGNVLVAGYEMLVTVPAVGIVPPILLIVILLLPVTSFTLTTPPAANVPVPAVEVIMLPDFNPVTALISVIVAVQGVPEVPEPLTVPIVPVVLTTVATVGTVTTAGSAWLIVLIGLAYKFGIKSVLIVVIIFSLYF
jgi:hypothetical protein